MEESKGGMEGWGGGMRDEGGEGRGSKTRQKDEKGDTLFVMATARTAKYFLTLEKRKGFLEERMRMQGAILFALRA